MKNGLEHHVSLARITIPLLSMLALVFGESSVMGTEEGERSSDPRRNSSVASLPPVLNELMLGCNQEGAINYLLERRLGRRLELVYGGLGRPPDEPAEKYDTVYVLRLGSKSHDTWSPEKICLYFREGYLAYKCVVLDEEVDPAEVFCREIASGLQHPPNYPGLMDKVHWGKPKAPYFDQFSPDTLENTENAGSNEPRVHVGSPKVRCGIVIDDLPPFAEAQGFNVLVVYQNVGPTVLSDDMLLMGFPIGPVISVRAKYRDRAVRTGFQGIFGIYGAKVYRLLNSEEEVTAVRGAAFRLEPGEMTYMWFRVPDLQLYASLQARVRGLWGAEMEDESITVRVWDAESPAVVIPERNGK